MGWRLYLLSSLAGLAGAAPTGKHAQSLLDASDLSEDARVFCIGPNKAGTMTLDTLFLNLPPGNWNPCHNTCDGKDMWSMLSNQHDASDDIWSKHRAFMDNGDQADFSWLDEAFPGSRFILNTRAMYDWVLSRFDMIRADREAAGCTPQGTTADCPNVYAHWGDNTDEDMLEWIMWQANHQEKVLEYFRQFPGRAQRFALIDVEGNQTEALARLHWVTRKDTSQWQIEGILRLHSSLPEGFIPADNLMTRETLPEANIGHHDEYSHNKVQSVLRGAGCTGEMDYDQTYEQCAALIRAKYPGARLATGKFNYRGMGLNATMFSSPNGTTADPQSPVKHTKLGRAHPRTMPATRAGSWM